MVGCEELERIWKELVMASVRIASVLAEIQTE
jgi:hypothetical protein